MVEFEVSPSDIFIPPDYDGMEAFEGIYLYLSRHPGKCRIAEKGLGWKPSAGGDTFTIDSSNIIAAQWSRAAKGYEVKVLSRNSGTVQLDGFEQEVYIKMDHLAPLADIPRGLQPDRQSVQAVL